MCNHELDIKKQHLLLPHYTVLYTPGGNKYFRLMRGYTGMTKLRGRGGGGRGWGGDVHTALESLKWISRNLENIVHRILKTMHMQFTPKLTIIRSVFQVHRRFYHRLHI